MLIATNSIILYAEESKKDLIKNSKAVLQKLPEGIEVSARELDFGEFREGQLRERKVIITNKTGNKISLGRLYSPCPCFQLTADTVQVENGGFATVNVSLHSLTLNGKKDFPLYVEIIGKKKDIVTLHATAVVERVPAKMVVHPEVIHLGAIKRGEKVKKEIRLFNLTKEPVEIIKIDPENNSIQAGVDLGISRINGGLHAKINVEIDTSVFKGRTVSSHILIYTDQNQHRVVRVPISGTIRD